MRAKGRYLACMIIALLASVLMVGLLAFPSRGNTAAGIPIPVNVPVPATVLHTDNFGYAMAIDGDILVVGAPWTKVDGKDQQGVAYIFTRNPNAPTDFTLLTSITGSDSSDHDSFGWAVDVHGDVVAVGAYGANQAAGAVYLFVHNQGGDNQWGEVKKLVRGDNRTLTNFGRALAMHGDTIAVGAPLGLGQVLLYQRNQGGDNQWGKTQTLTAGYTITPTIRVASFGETIAFDGNRLVISAPKESVTAQDLPPGSPAPASNFSGAVYIFQQENGQWVREAKLLSGDIDPATNYFGLSYGASLALNGDLLFVGETSGQNNGVDTGKVYVYQRGGGTPSSFGQPGAWGEVAELSPSDGVARDSFGWAIYAVDDGLFVSAQKQGVGKVYFFRNPVASAGVTFAQSPLAWAPVYSFTANATGSTRFGFPVVGSGDSVVIGDQAANDGRGGLLAYAKPELFVADPNATPSPTATPTVVPSPTATPPVGPVACNASSSPQQRLYLPLITSQSTSDAATAPTTAVATAFINSLAPGCVITSPIGVKVGAVPGAITATLTLSISVTAPPTVTLPAVATVQGNYFRLAANRDRLVPMDTPFVLGVPVPAGADTAHLVLLHTYDSATLLDSDATDVEWGYLPGLYDAASQLFLARLPYVLAEGSTFVLVNHPDFDTSVNPPALVTTVQGAAVDQPAAHSFDAWCMLETFADPTACTSDHESTVAAMANAIYTRMTETFFYPKTLRLLDTTGQFIVNEAVTSTQRNATYAIHIVSAADRRCRNALGFYQMSTGFLALCLTAGEPIDSAAEETLIHEMFHAFQYTYPLVMRQWEDGRKQEWAIEGMAEAAIKSYPGTVMKRSPYYGEHNLQDVDKGLIVGIPRDGKVEEYLAQDFWVYVGASQGRGLEYLHGVLALGGANHLDHDFAFQTIFQRSFSDLYWGWVKNQAIENSYDVGAGTGDLCRLSENALQTGLPAEFLASKQYFPYDTGSAYDRLPPLTAKVIELKFGAKTGATVSTGYRDCVGLQDPVAFATCKVVAQQSLRVKIYIEDESQCWTQTLPGVVEEGVRQLTNLSDAHRYFVVVANVDPHNEQAYYLAIE